MMTIGQVATHTLLLGIFLPLLPPGVPAGRATGVPSSTPVTSCDQLTEESLDAEAKAANLTPVPGLNFSVKVNFVDHYRGEPTDPWTLDQQKVICAAVRHFQLAWSSVEFKQQLASIPSMILARRFLHPDLVVSGSDLYTSLVRNPVTINLAHSADVPQCAISEPTGNTSIQTDYVDNGTRFGCGKPLIPALTNTLAHEVTHYSSAAGSTDNRKSSVNNLNWVSYGVGCITEDIAFQGSLCKYGAY